MTRPPTDYHGQMPMVTFVVTLAAIAIAIGITLVSVYSGLFWFEVWWIALTALFLALHPVAGWAFRRNRRS